MNPMLSLKFFEREFLLDPSTGLTKDTRLVVVRNKEDIKIGRVIDPQKVKNLQYLDTLLFETELELTEGQVDLAGILARDRNGVRWLELFRRHHEGMKPEYVNTNLRIENIPFKSFFYTKCPNDYFERVQQYGFGGYRAPRGRIEKIPDGTFHVRILAPPSIFRDGEWSSYSDIRRRVVRPDGIEEEYLMNGDEGHLVPVRGVLLGKLGIEDIKDPTGEFEGGFPLNHFAKIVYSVALSEAGEHNSLLTSLKLKNEK